MPLPLHPGRDQEGQGTGLLPWLTGEPVVPAWDFSAVFSFFLQLFVLVPF